MSASLAASPAAAPWARRLLLARGLRGFADGFIAVLLPAYLQALGLSLLQVGLIATLTLAGSAFATLALGALGHRWPAPRLLRGAALLMAATGLGFAGLCGFWPLALVAFVGTLNPSSGDVSVFLPIEHARLAVAAQGHARTRLFGRYALTGSLSAACGALASGLPLLLHEQWRLPMLDALRLMFVAYAAVGALVWLLYAGLPRAGAAAEAPPAPLGASRPAVLRLALLFSVDSFAGGLIVNALLAAWLQQRFGLSLAEAGRFFFLTGLLGTLSLWLAPRLAERVGLVNTMVWTHIPASLLLMAAALVPQWPLAMALLLARSLLSQMDVPARSAFVMAVVSAPERAAAASFTAVPRSLAASLSPSLGAALLAAGWPAAPLLLCGALKIGYDLALWRRFRGTPEGSD
ncbi:MFS transporter [Roseateles sp. DAIF2]|uniref:MFS transporter n=1 Tax=Roseateles sp. DAIF2 TaxID=2714952 RepID=UPI0018A2F931|nr:MFS transporter [Roseateles sp. DAIF2]QPF75251.1 MFS transporter [Roseateles sp. DAIF2]